MTGHHHDTTQRLFFAKIFCDAPSHFWSHLSCRKRFEKRFVPTHLWRFMKIRSDASFSRQINSRAIESGLLSNSVCLLSTNVHKKRTLAGHWNPSLSQYPLTYRVVPNPISNLIWLAPIKIPNWVYNSLVVKPVTSQPQKPLLRTAPRQVKAMQIELHHLRTPNLKKKVASAPTEAKRPS